MAEIYRTATEYLANEIKITRGKVSDITAVGVYHSTDPSYIPSPGDFTRVTLVDGTTEPPDPLAERGVGGVLSLVGPRGVSSLPPGDHQRWVLVQTASEDIIRRVDVVTVR